MIRYATSALLLATLVGCAAPETLDRAQEPLIGGELAETDDAVVALTRSGGGSFCTGTLVSPSIVLTAAHCIDMAGADEIVVFFGNDTNSEGTRIGTRKVQRHPSWSGSVNGPGYHYDIGLILLN